MALVATDNKHYAAIAEAIRNRTNADKKYTPADMAQGVNESYWKGALDFGLRQTTEGKVIVADDVSDIEHNVAVTLSSDVISDFSGVKVTRCGKNLLPAEALDENNWVYDGYWYYYLDLPSGDYILSAKSNVTDGNYGYWYIETSSDNFQTKTVKYITAGNTISKLPRNFTINEGETARLFWSTSGGVKTPWGLYSECQIERGLTASEYEPSNHQSATPNADGTVEGITSLAPTMTLMTDNADVSIKCEYFADAKKKIESLTAQ